MRSQIRESDIEAALVRFAKKLGIYTRKFTSPAHRGVPDRVFVIGGRVLFMEIKRPGEVPTALQKHEMELLRKVGANVEMVDNALDGRNVLLHLVSCQPRTKCCGHELL
jgi:Holliday junction resolvase